MRYYFAKAVILKMFVPAVWIVLSGNCIGIRRIIAMVSCRVAKLVGPSMQIVWIIVVGVGLLDSRAIRMRNLIHRTDVSAIVGGCMTVRVGHRIEETA